MQIGWFARWPDSLFLFCPRPAPGAVGHLSFTQILDTSLKVSWSEPGEKNGVLTGTFTSRPKVILHREEGEAGKTAVCPRLCLSEFTSGGTEAELRLEDFCCALFLTTSFSEPVTCAHTGQLLYLIVVYFPRQPLPGPPELTRHQIYQRSSETTLVRKQYNFLHKTSRCKQRTLSPLPKVLQTK